jgi:hypothetical protein
VIIELEVERGDVNEADQSLLDCANSISIGMTNSQCSL